MINRQLAMKVKSLMPSRERESDINSPVSMWNELDRLCGKPEETAVVIFRTRGCAWYDFSSCSMCGYFNDVNTNVTLENLKAQIDKLNDFIESQKVLKVFTSGSFLDRREVPDEAIHYFLKTIGGKIEKLLVESRTEFITDNTMMPLKDSGISTRIAIGVESANDAIIKNSINKGTNFQKFVDAAKKVKSSGLELRSYLLLKPLFLNEELAVRDAIKSAQDCAPYSTDVSVNPMNIQKNTLVESLWKKGLYRPPWLWSVARVLLECEKLPVEVLSYPTGGNSDRGAHNNSKDPELLKLIFDASLEQNFDALRTYYNNADLTVYRKYMEVESGLLEPIDMDSRIRKMKSGTVQF